MKRPQRLRFESLESRQAMAADITAVLAGGVLTITGDDGGAIITIDRTASQIRVVETDQSFLVSKVKSIAIALGDGDDTVKVNSVVSRSPWSGTAIRIETEGGADQLQIAGRTVFFGDDPGSLTVDKKGNVKIDGARPTWFDNNVPLDEFGIQARQLAADQVLNRDDMLALFDTAAENDVLGVDDFNALRAIGNNRSLFKTVDYVYCLTGYVVNSNVANAQYQGNPLDDLNPESTDVHLRNLVDKWFRGKDHPVATFEQLTFTYAPASGTLFNGDPNYTQVFQGADGDCYFLSSLNAIAAHNPQRIEDMFIDNGDGTYVVRFFDQGRPRYITVDSMFPVYQGVFPFDKAGRQLNDPSNVLWAALAEKAYVQMAELGWTRPKADSINSYQAIDGGNPADTLRQISGDGATYSKTDHLTAKQLSKAWLAGKPVVLGTNDPSGSPEVVPDHAYALISYDAQTQEFTLANPWNVTPTQYPATLSLTVDEIRQYYGYWFVGDSVT